MENRNGNDLLADRHAGGLHPAHHAGQRGVAAYPLTVGEARVVRIGGRIVVVMGSLAVLTCLLISLLAR